MSTTTFGTEPITCSWRRRRSPSCWLRDMQCERDAFPVPSISRPKLMLQPDWKCARVRREKGVERVYRWENQVKNQKSRPRIPKEKKKKRRNQKRKMFSDQNKTLGRVSQDRADDERASTNLPHANWRLTALLASNRQATDDLILDDG